MSARSFYRERERAIQRNERRGALRAKRIAVAAGGLLATAAVAAPVANASDFVVDSHADNGDGKCQGLPANPPGPGDGSCTLRDAIIAANQTPNSPGSTPDKITFASGLNTIQLVTGSIQISGDALHIQGPGADKLTVQGPPSDRIFKMLGFGSGPDNEVTMSGLTLSGGNRTDGPGGAIYSSNAACSGAAALTLKAVHIDDNTADRAGGGVAVESFTCTESENKAAGAPSSETGALNVIDSTISNNVAGNEGGGIAMGRDSGPLFVSNSTIAANEAGGAGGGISVAPFAANPGPTNKTIAEPVHNVGNSTVVGNLGVGTGGGIYTEANLGLRSTIVHSNVVDEPEVTGKATIASDLATGDATISAGYSDIGTRDGATVIDVTGEPNISADPQLPALGNNGGPTPTLLPAKTSPVIDLGISNALTSDQRGLPRTADRPPANVADGTDIGAVEVAADPPPPDEPIIEPDPEPTPIPGPATEACLGKQVIVTKGTDADETLKGTDADDGILGSGGVDAIAGLSGNDCLFGQGGADTLDGDDGNDKVQGNRDGDVVNGGAGSDDVRGQNGNDQVNGGAGDDRKITGGAGSDKITGGSGDDYIKGDGGNDIIHLGSGKDLVLAGGGGDEIFAADGDKDVVLCGTGKDIAHVDAKDVVDEDCNTVKTVD